MNFILQRLQDGFRDAFPDSARAPRLFFAPGRVNIIGEHIDYNGGLVLPCALTLGTYAAIRERGDDTIRLVSANCGPPVTLCLKEMARNPNHGWANYPKGVVSVLPDYALRGFDMYIWGDLPNGAGLSSSASLMVLTATAINSLFGLKISPLEIAKLCQRAENEYIGVNCGIMDPFASAMGKEGQAVLLDCNTLEYAYIPLALGDYRLVVANTRTRRSLADSKYNERRLECERALAALRKVCKIRALCDLTPEAFFTHSAAIGEEIPRKRAEHAVMENHRAKEAAKALKTGNMAGLFPLMAESHVSLRDLYDVAGMHLDTLVQAAYAFGKESPLGARMTGAGFGGCTVNIVHKDAVTPFIDGVGREYHAKTGLKADFYVSWPGEGAREVL